VAAKFFLPFLRSIAFWPVHVAEEQGYFEQEGLNIASEATDGSSFVVQQVAAGSAEFGIATSDPILLGFEQSPNFTVPYDFLTGNVFDLWATDKSGITDLAGLKGKIIAVKDMSGGEVPGLQVALEKAGLKSGTDVEIQAVGEEGAIQAEALRSNKVQAFMVSWNSLVGVRSALEKEGIKLVCLTCGDTSIRGSEAVVVSNKFLAEHPDLVAGMGRALAKATLFGETNPDAALAIMKKVNPDEQADPAVAKAYFTAALDITKPRPSGKFGEVSTDAWQRSVDLLLSPDVPSGLKGPVDLSKLLSNAMLEQFNDFDHDAVKAEATNYKP
jgi:NitT/TauT family transport system substrate-binding protein